MYAFFFLSVLSVFGRAGFVAVHGLSLICMSRGTSLVTVHRLLVLVSSLLSPGSRLRGFSSCGSQALEHRLVVGPGLSCPAACGALIFLDWGWDPCLLHCR